MRLFFIIFVFILFTNEVSAQSASSWLNANDYIVGERLHGFIDSLKKTILSDTTKFNSSDLKHTDIGISNKNSYSLLYIINGRYAYKMDVIEAKDVKEFVDELFVEGKVKEIMIMDGHIASRYFSAHTWKSVAVISLNDGVKFNPQIAGYNRESKNNFSQRRKGRIRIKE